MEVGNKVKIINYGHLIYITAEEYKIDSFPLIKTYPSGIEVRDMSPELVGQEGVVSEVSNDGDQYMLSGPKKAGWYNEEQLELID